MHCGDGILLMKKNDCQAREKICAILVDLGAKENGAKRKCTFSCFVPMNNNERTTASNKLEEEKRTYA